MIAAGARVLPEFASLPRVGVSLSDAIKAGKTRFLEMGMDRAYTVAPADSTADEGERMYERLVAMVVGEVTEGISLAMPKGP